MTSKAYVFTKRKLEVNIKLCRTIIISLKLGFVNRNAKKLSLVKKPTLGGRGGAGSHRSHSRFLSPRLHRVKLYTRLGKLLALRCKAL